MKRVFSFFISFAFFCNVTLSGQETTDVRIQMKATNNLQTTHPLIFVNGFETNMESMMLAPKNIESINILKGESAMADYGEKAKDGVVLIFTKPGVNFRKITDFVDPCKKNNADIKEVHLNGKPLSTWSYLLIDNSFTVTTVASGDPKINYGCGTHPKTRLNISAKSNDVKE